MIDDFSAQPLVDSVGGFGKQISAHTAQHPLQQGYHHQANAQHLQCIEAALGDHLIDDHLDQQRVGQAKQLHYKRGQQYLQQHAAIAPEGRPKPARPKALLRSVHRSLHQQQFDTFREGLLQLFRAELQLAPPGAGQGEAGAVAGDGQGKTAIPLQHAGDLQPAAHVGRHLGTHHMQAQAGAQLAAELDIGALAAAQAVAQHLFDRILAEGQLHLGRQHLEASQGFLQGAFAADQAETRQRINLAEAETTALG